VGGIVVQQYLAHERSSQKPAQVAQVAVQQPQPIEPRAEPSYMAEIAPQVKKPANAPTTKPSAAAKVPYQASDMTAVKVAPQSEATATAATSAAASVAVDQPPGNVVGGVANSFKATVPTQNAFAPPRQSGSQVQGFAGGRMSAMPQAFMRQSGSKTWRATPDGHLEHLSPTGWTAVLTDQPTKFRVVTESPNGVWAGGSRGELFHSEDGGEHWSEIALPIPPDGNNDPLVAIHLADVQHGIILTESGARYSTSDGGKNWQRE
jgi:hypothetical protein